MSHYVARPLIVSTSIITCCSDLCTHGPSTARPDAPTAGVLAGPLAPLPGVSIPGPLIDEAVRVSEAGTRGVSDMYHGILGQMGKELEALRRQDIELQNLLNQVQVKRGAIRQKIASGQGGVPNG